MAAKFSGGKSKEKVLPNNACMRHHLHKKIDPAATRMRGLFCTSGAAYTSKTDHCNWIFIRVVCYPHIPFYLSQAHTSFNFRSSDRINGRR